MNRPDWKLREALREGAEDGLLVDLDARIDGAENDGIRARWEFGKQLLTERKGKQLPPGRLDAVARLIEKSREEVTRRMTFALRFPSEEEVSHAVTNFGSWHRIVNEALASTAHLSSEKDEWATPADLFAALNAEFNFTLDVCATAKNAKCPRYLTEADDGLWHSWAGEVVFMNPPYSKVDQWMGKAALEGENGATVVCLVPSRTDVGWFWEHARRGQIRFIRGRVHFVDDVGKTGPAPFPSTVVVFGANYPPGLVWFWWGDDEA